jgi:hypothetical protein
MFQSIKFNAIHFSHLHILLFMFEVTSLIIIQSSLQKQVIEFIWMCPNADSRKVGIPVTRNNLVTVEHMPG